MLAEGADRALACAVVARPARLVIAIEQMRIAAHGAIRTHQGVGRQLLAAAACDQDLAFGDDRCCEIENDRLGVGARNADAERGGREPAIDPAERRHQHASRRIDEMDRDKARFRGHSCPIADASDMPGIAQRNRGKPVLPALFDSELDRLRRDRLAESIAAVDHGQRRRVDEDRDLLVRDHAPFGFHLHIARDTDHAVAVVAGEVGRDQIFGDAAPLLGRAAGFDEDLGDELLEHARLQRDHRFRSVLRLQVWKRRSDQPFAEHEGIAGKLPSKSTGRRRRGRARRLRYGFPFAVTLVACGGRKQKPSRSLEQARSNRTRPCRRPAAGKGTSR